MKVSSTRIPSVLVIELKVHHDLRGLFFESYHAACYESAGMPTKYVQDNFAQSLKGVLRGLHFQHPHTQEKLVSVLQGEVFDVAVDIRRSSFTYGQWVGIILSAENHRQLLVPAGFAHGFCVTSESAILHYKCSDYYHPECEETVLWNDPDLAIAWPIDSPLLSDKDMAGKPLRDFDPGRLPRFSGAEEPRS